MLTAQQTLLNLLRLSQVAIQLHRNQGVIHTAYQKALGAESQMLWKMWYESHKKYGLQIIEYTKHEILSAFWCADELTMDDTSQRG